MKPIRENIIQIKTFDFAVRSVNLYKHLLTKKKETIISKQVFRSGTSIGANAEEAQEGQTKADYIAKMSVSSKEARESHWWLRLSVAAGVAKREEVEWELGEADELRMMLRAAIRTARSSQDRGHSVQ